MNYETIKSFILFVLVGISFLLSYILWSYQPNYELFQDTSYINEVNIGGDERTKNELIAPKDIVFRAHEKAFHFVQPLHRNALYKDIASWVLYDYKMENAQGRPKEEHYVEIVFPSAIPAELILNLFTFHDEVEPPNWSFQRAFITVNEDAQTLELTILSVDHRKQITAMIEKTEAYQTIVDYLAEEQDTVMEGIVLGSKDSPIYVPKNEVELSRKTVVAGHIEHGDFINALFPNPNLVTPNLKEAYFTDGQRGMKVVQEGRRLEYINPLQSNYDRIDPIDLFEKSVHHINDHRGWTDDFIFDHIDTYSKRIQYRMNYEGYPVFDYQMLTVIEQEWRQHELYKYNRPLIYIGNFLNSQAFTLPSGEKVVEYLKKDKNFTFKNIKDIQVGYSLHYIDEAHSLTLEPNWFILYEDEWMKYDIYAQQSEEMPRRD